MRGPVTWIVGIAIGLVLVVIVTAMIGNRDDSDESVSAGEWAQNVCGAVGVWRGELEATVEQIRTPPAAAGGDVEPQSETPQERTGFIRTGLERAVQATETMVEGVENAGVPDTAEGGQVADIVSDWADSALDDLEDAEDSLDEEADSLEESITQLTGAARAVATVLTSGTQTLAEIARADPAVAAALRDASTCQELREEAS